MRNSIILTGLVAGLVAAAPAPFPQTAGIDIAAINAVTYTTSGAPLDATAASSVATYDASSAASSAAAAAETSPVVTTAAAAKKLKRDDSGCSTATAQPSGYGPSVTPDTPSAFVTASALTSVASAAATPVGYSNVFTNLQGSTSQEGYMGYYTLTSYDTVECGQYCSAADGCSSFNIYYERDPTYAPQTGCDDPPSTTNIKCALWGLPISAATATNDGQWRDDFEVVITGSNGYVSDAAPSSQTNFTGPSDRLGGAIQAPLNADGSDPYIGMSMFAGPYNPAQCAAVCQQTTTYDAAHPASDGSYDTCNFFNSYVLSENNVPLGTYCAYYTTTFDRSYATNTGQYDSEGNYYSVSESYSYTLTSDE